MTNRADINKVETYIATVVQQFDESISLSKESSFYDLFVRFYVFTALLNILDILSKFEAAQSYTNIAMPEADYDKLLNRWLFQRETGLATSFTVGMVFSTDSNVFNIRTTDIFTADSFQFSPIANKTINRPNYDAVAIDNTSSEYTIKFDVLALQIGSDVAVNIGDTVVIPYTTFNGFLRAYVDALITPGSNSESNSAAFERLQESITIEGFTSRISINGQFARELPGIVKSHVVVGYTEPEMYRDGFYTQLPQRQVRLLFSSKTNVSLKHKDSFGNVITKFYYNRDPSIVYHLRLPDGINNAVKLATDIWEIHPSGYFIMDVDVTMASTENPIGFKDDVGVNAIIGNFDLTTGAAIGETNLVDVNSSFLTAYSSTRPAGIEVPPAYNLTTTGTTSPVIVADLALTYNHPTTSDLAQSKTVAAIQQSLASGSLHALVNAGAITVDIVNNHVFDNFLVHMGGFTDIHVDVNVNRISRKFKVPLDSGGVIQVPDVYKPILKLHTALDNTGLPVAFSGLDVLDFKNRFTARDTTQVLIDPGLAGTDVTLDFFYAPDVQTIDAFVLEPNTAIPSDQTQVRFKCPVFVSIIAEVSVIGDSASIGNQLRTAFFSYINSIIEQPTVPVAKIISSMDQAIPELANIVSFNVFATQYMPDGTTIDLVTENSIIPETNLSMGVSNRTTKFIPESAEFIFI